MNFIDFFASFQELYQRKLTPFCAKYGLTSMEATILLFLADNPRYDRAADLVQKRHLSKSHVSLSVRSLEEKGLLRREFRDGNRRSEHLVLREESRALVSEGLAVQKDFLSLISRGLGPEDRESLMAHLLVIRDNVQKGLAE